MKANFKKETETAKLPTRANNHAAGIDFYSDEAVIIRPGRSRAISTGVSWHPEGVNGIIALVIQSRSGLAFRLEIEASNAGVIDQDYRGIIKVKLYNHSTESVHIHQGDKICQGVPQSVPYFEDIENLKSEERGNNGFGSSGR